MGNSHGMFTIYVEPLSVAHENSMVRMVRTFEDSVLPYLTPSDNRPPAHPTISFD